MDVSRSWTVESFEHGKDIAFCFVDGEGKPVQLLRTHGLIGSARKSYVFDADGKKGKHLFTTRDKLKTISFLGQAEGESTKDAKRIASWMSFHSMKIEDPAYSLGEGKLGMWKEPLMDWFTFTLTMKLERKKQEPEVIAVCTFKKKESPVLTVYKFLDDPQRLSWIMHCIMWFMPGVLQQQQQQGDKTRWVVYGASPWAGLVYDLLKQPDTDFK